MLRCFCTRRPLSHFFLSLSPLSLSLSLFSLSLSLSLLSIYQSNLFIYLFIYLSPIHCVVISTSVRVHSNTQTALSAAHRHTPLSLFLSLSLSPTLSHSLTHCFSLTPTLSLSHHSLLAASPPVCGFSYTLFIHTPLPL